MKILKLSEFLGLINGDLIQGSPEMEIRKVAKMIKYISEYSLYFHTGKKAINAHSFQGKKNFTIVTEDKDILSKVNGDTTVIMVTNCKDSYWRFIDFYRNQFSIPVVGVTGTCGKTTTKDMIKHILNKSLKVHSTFFSQNGLHLNLQYLMGINDQTEAAVFEMGVAYPGNIKNSGKYFKPTIGVITNIGEAHLEGCRTLENYIRAKGEMLEVLSVAGTLIINSDDYNIKRLPINSFKGKLFSFGLGQEANLKAENIQYEKDGMHYTLFFENNKYDVYIPGHGEHNVYNSLAAIATTNIIGIPIEDAVKRLSTYYTMERHVKIYNGSNNITVIDDTWSCNPSSVKSAIEVLKKLSNGKKEVLVLGKMQRLGIHEKKQHIKMGQTIIDNGGVDYLITVGQSAKLTGERAITLGMEPGKVHFVANAAELEAKLAEMKEETMILFKMSLGKMDPSFRTVVEKYRRNDKL